MIGCNESTKINLSYSERDRIKLGADEGSDLGSSDGSFDGYKYGNLEGSLFGESLGLEVGTQIGPFHLTSEGNEDDKLKVSLMQDSLRCTDGIVHVYNEVIKLDLSESKLIIVEFMFGYRVG